MKVIALLSCDKTAPMATSDASVVKVKFYYNLVALIQLVLLNYLFEFVKGFYSWIIILFL